MRFGFHISIAGGLSKVGERAQERGCESIQIFSRNPRGWKYGPLDPDEVARLATDLKELDIRPLVVHMPYLPNLATADEELDEKSVDSLAAELERAETLSAPYVVMHVGRQTGVEADEAARRVAQGVNQAMGRAAGSAMLLLENTAGQAGELGDDFRHTRAILEALTQPERVGVCFDTAHAFEAGYEVSTQEGLDGVLAEFDEMLGLDRLKVLHLNDSKTALGSHADRHWHIGEGFIGLEGFRVILNHPELQGLPGIMETPRGLEEDQRNMEVVRGLVAR